MRNFSKTFSSSYSSGKPKLMTKTFRFPDPIPKEKKIQNISSSKSFKLMMSQGYIKHISPGIFSLMPLAVRTLEKLCHLVDQVMTNIDAQKVLFPTLIQDSLFKTSGRWENNDNLFKLRDRHKSEFCLGPTHEEIATQLLSRLNISYKALPLKLYQISTKFRDEMNPKLGFLRGREFIMKDMYTFDSCVQNAELTYETVCKAYIQLFKLLDIDVIKVKGSSGDIGGESSHEFHIISDIGEDEIFYCLKCRNGINSELLSGGEVPTCHSCNSNYHKANAIEVGHAFLLGTSYSKPFQAEYDNSNHKHELLQMGCYGLGITRIIAACIEHFSTLENIKLPLLLAPYLLSVIIPKKGSKEEPVLPFAESLSVSLNSTDWLASNVIVDDRTNLTIGKRVQEASAIGIPYAVVVGSSAMDDVPKVEFIDFHNSETLFLTHKEIMDYFRWKKKINICK